jgi:hypothetical protein
MPLVGPLVRAYEGRVTYGWDIAPSTFQVTYDSNLSDTAMRALLVREATSGAGGHMAWPVVGANNARAATHMRQMRCR